MPTYEPNTFLDPDGIAFNYGRLDKATTTGSGYQTLVEIGLVDKSVVLVEARIVGVEDGGGNAAAFILYACIRRNGAGALVQGSVGDAFSVKSDSHWNATIDTDGNNYRIRVDGYGAKVYWRVNTKIILRQSE